MRGRGGEFLLGHILVTTLFISCGFLLTQPVKAKTVGNNRILSTRLYQLKYAKFYKNVDVLGQLSLNGAFVAQRAATFNNVATFVGSATFAQGITLQPQTIADIDTADLADGSVYYDADTNTLQLLQDAEWKTVAWTSDIPQYTFGSGLSTSGTTVTATLGSSVASDEIVNGTVALADLSSMGCETDEILKYGGSSWGCTVDETGSGGGSTLDIDSTTVSGTLEVTNGGTGAATHANNGVLYGSGASAIQATTAGTSGQFLVANGSSVPTFVSMNSDATLTSAGALTVVNNAVALGTDTTGEYVASVANGTGITGGDGGSEAASLTLAVDQDAAFSWSNGHTWTLAGSEMNQTNLTLSGSTSSQAAGIALTNGTTSGNQYGVYIDNVAASGATEALLALDNSDTDTALAAAITVIDAGGGFTNILDNAGTLLSGAEFNLLDSGITFSDLTNSGTLTATTVDINGGAIDGSTIGASSASTGRFTTLASTGATTLGDDSATVAINSSDWDILATGAMTGLSFDANGTGNSISNIDNADLTADTLDFDSVSDALTLDAATIITRTSNAADENTLTFSYINNGGTAGTDQAIVLSNAISTNTTGDVNTEALVLLDQADTTASGTTTLDQAVYITNSGGSTLTNGIKIGTSTQAIGTALNIASTGVTTDISLQNGETIDNNVDGTLQLTATTTALSGGLQIGTGTTILKHVSGTATNLVSSAVSTITCGAYGTITVTGAAVGDTVVATPDPSSSATGIEDNNLSWSSYVSSSNTVTITACNPTLGSINAGDDQEWRADVWEH